MIETMPTRPDSSGIRVKALAASNKATRMRTNSRPKRNDKAPSILSKKNRIFKIDKIKNRTTTMDD